MSATVVSAAGLMVRNGLGLFMCSPGHSMRRLSSPSALPLKQEMHVQDMANFDGQKSALFEVFGVRTA
ncbi:hypothetical protein T03_2564 [Trichinella britovi]|uniref:Uncharacterized protein n=1 Tax=Trichinella britovi TaxID=45882 RepID=A0A0V1CRN9_TRIBR|nr:hypothetical protein T03_2564 [Trichinella britovi]